MKRILHVVGNMDYGGVETLLMSLYRALDRERFQFDFLEHNDVEGRFDEEIRSLGGRILRIPGVGASSVPAYQRALRATFDSHPEYQVVHSHLDAMNGVVLRQAKVAGVPVRISHSHIHNASYGPLQTVLRHYSRLVLPGSATHGLACSGDAADFVHSGGLRRETRILRNGIDTTRFTFRSDEREIARRELSLGPDAFAIGHVASLTDQKNHSFLIDMFGRVASAVDGARLVLVGVGPLMEAVRAQVSTNKLDDKVMFLGARQDVEHILAAMDVFVFPSLYEGLGIAAIEAQSMGLPTLVSTAVPREAGITDRIEFLELNEKDWAGRLLDLSQHPIHASSEYASRVAVAGYGIDQVAQELQGLYDSAIAAIAGTGHPRSGWGS